MVIEYREYLEVPDNLLEQWSYYTQQEQHLTTETAESLKGNMLMSTVAFVADNPVGFAGLIAARTAEGHGLIWNNLPVIELGGAYINPLYRGHGIWYELVERRLRHARSQSWFIVCVTGNPIVQHGLRKVGGTHLDLDIEGHLCKQLCLNCSPISECSYCPLQKGNSWRLM